MRVQQLFQKIYRRMRKGYPLILYFCRRDTLGGIVWDTRKPLFVFLE